MNYLKVEWIHSNDDYPVLLYSEVDSNRMETRKVEIFRSGFIGSADAESSVGKTGLGLEPIPTTEEIAADPQFRPVHISKEEFEEVWAKRNQLANPVRD